MKDSSRLILAMVASAVVMMVYLTYFAPQQAPVQPDPQPQSAVTQKAPSAPQAAPSAQKTSPAPPAPSALSNQNEIKRDGRDIVVETGKAVLVFNELGGVLKKVTLKDYYNEAGKKGGNYVLFEQKPGQNPNLGLDLVGATTNPLSREFFQADQKELKTTKGGANQLSLTAKVKGLTVTKTYVFNHEGYDFKLYTNIKSQADAPLTFTPELFMSQSTARADGNSYAFTGTELWLDGKFEELDVSDLEEKPVKTGKVTWVSMNIPYFISIMAPVGGKEDTKRAVRGITDKVTFTTTLLEPTLQLNPGQATGHEYQIYMGPMEMDFIEPLGHEMVKAVDFGWFDLISKPMLILLEWINGFVGNYGVSIIIITLLTKLLFWPLTKKSYKSMKVMRKLQPQVDKIRKKYADDKQKMNQEVMQLYKTYKANPMGGCVPMIVQIPVFIGFYKLLGSAIQIRHQPFMLWINDLSAPDRLNIGFDIPYVGGLPVLTLLMGASMFLQQKMTPTMGDPAQQKMMLLMPIVFTFLFINFPSGLVLYWLVSNVVGIGQQYFINKSQKA